ncbi:unnamed protein product (macronuclear) [Paramecium tetraurelia]|uniref:Uncharacterized protein n=1 Tax=Paramecium tetraurelia TaxID=5888 RepID=A0BB95_PARTE|nr:uncharacterized protein GSPATT00000247001 [Paramecium tetraurelia]CAK55812.1 unnamed protein product [Paramecium tetraurelia]|eukprot:XP_001423210.1 hypothetical protein (macronuclear) [Paramecium tetraurelia strain d4-2]
MTTWRALISPSNNVSLQESNKESIDNRIHTLPKGRHTKTITQSTNISHQKPTIKRLHSKSIDIDQAFIKSSSDNLLDEINDIDEGFQYDEIKEMLIRNSINLKKLHKDIDIFDYNQRQIKALQKQILFQRSKYNLRINSQINNCNKKLQQIQSNLQSNY